MTVQDQRAQALVLAELEKSRRREVRVAVREGRVSLAVALVDPRAARMKVGRLLGEVPGVGPIKAERILRAAKLGESRTCGSLTGDGRRRLLRAVALVPAGARAATPAEHGQAGRPQR